MLPPSKSESTLMRTNKLIFIVCMALASPFVAMATVIFLGALGGAVFGITLLVTHVPYSGFVLLGLAALAAFAYAASGRARMRSLRQRIAALESDLTEARMQVKELEHGVAFDRKLKSDQND
jgi:hypothetical protein